MTFLIHISNAFLEVKANFFLFLVCEIADIIVSRFCYFGQKLSYD